jgi:hypothetical protein
MVCGTNPERSAQARSIIRVAGFDASRERDVLWIDQITRGTRSRTAADARLPWYSQPCTTSGAVSAIARRNAAKARGES